MELRNSTSVVSNPKSSSAPASSLQQQHFSSTASPPNHSSNIPNVPLHSHLLSLSLSLSLSLLTHSSPLLKRIIAICLTLYLPLTLSSQSASPLLPTLLNQSLVLLLFQIALPSFLPLSPPSASHVQPDDGLCVCDLLSLSRSTAAGSVLKAERSVHHSSHAPRPAGDPEASSCPPRSSIAQCSLLLPRSRPPRAAISVPHWAPR
ncbi:hypothetical protein Mapa_012900 [Marchantia paleacea]|nr:hypothetical protein Mapa_012900 [Marchantia paleacea]